jgi:hypothetical protein
MKGPIGCSFLALILIAASCSPARAGQLWNGRGSDVMMQAAKAQLEQVGAGQTQPKVAIDVHAGACKSAFACVAQLDQCAFHSAWHRIFPFAGMRCTLSRRPCRTGDFDNCSLCAIIILLIVAITSPSSSPSLSHVHLAPQHQGQPHPRHAFNERRSACRGC